MFSFLTNPLVQAFSSVLTAAAGVILIACPPHTIAYKVATAVVAFGAAHGIQSTSTTKK